MNDIKVRQGARLDLQVTTQSEDAVSATLILRDSDGHTEDFTAEYVDKVANFVNVEGIAELEVGEYEYQINDNYASGDPDKYPDAADCDDDCEFPKFIVCEALDESES